MSESFEVLFFSLIESSSDFLLQDALSLTDTTGELILLMKGRDMLLHLGTDEIGHLGLGVVLMAVGAGDTALFIWALTFLAVFAALLNIAGIVIASHG